MYIICKLQRYLSWVIEQTYYLWFGESNKEQIVYFAPAYLGGSNKLMASLEVSLWPGHMIRSSHFLMTLSSLYYQFGKFISFDSLIKYTFYGTIIDPRQTNSRHHKPYKWWTQDMT